MVSLLPSSSMSLPHAFPLSSSFVFAQQKCSFHWHPATATAMWSCMEISCFLIDMFVLPKPFLILKGIYQLCFWTMMMVSFWFLPVEQSQSVPHISCATKNQDGSFFFKEILTCVGCLQLTNKATLSFHFLNCLSNLGLGRRGLNPVDIQMGGGASWTGLPLTQKARQPCTLTSASMANQESKINLTCMSVDCQEAALQEGNPHSHKENMQTPQDQTTCASWKYYCCLQLSISLSETIMKVSE